MFSSKTTDNLDFVGRQLTSLLDRYSMDEAFARLTQGSPDSYMPDIQRLRKIVEGSRTDEVPLGANAYATLSKLIPEMTRSGGDRITLFVEFNRYLRRVSAIYQTYWAGMLGMLWYLATLLGIAVLITSVFVTTVAPQFKTLFGSLGATLPPITDAIFMSGSLPGLLLGVAIVFVATLIYLAILCQRRLQQLAPLRPWPRWFPFFGELVQTYNRGLFLNFARLGVLSGVDANRALQIAASLTCQQSGIDYSTLAAANPDTIEDSVVGELAIAARIDNLNGEIEFQCEQQFGVLAEALVNARERGGLIIKLILYLLIGTLIVAMYQPIFEMGSVIM